MVTANLLILLLKLVPLSNLARSIVVGIVILTFCMVIWIMVQKGLRKRRIGCKVLLWIAIFSLFFGICRMLPYLDYRTKTLHVELYASAEPEENGGSHRFLYSVYGQSESFWGRNRELEQLPFEIRSILMGADFERSTYIVSYGYTMPEELHYCIWNSVGFPVPFIPQVYQFPPDSYSIAEKTKAYIGVIPYLPCEFE